ncbi:hypothetical protein [Arcticibacterium luteifluviistationis]|uniref:Lipocalin-like domain-containing protein n=1 Tax=Arcticibacterium luteifluviistationis TaxID=1784714 RepID=A0A2Z4GH05_9BACT|nr:hypothetical protein [Arcticibacterium luteifluviistationis]AWW00670.1 hypothetical protein DJ013_21775 [Arcticibacterium luteifluviistationis]
MKNLLFAFLIIFTFSCTKDSDSEMEPEQESEQQSTLNIVGTWESDYIFTVSQKSGANVLNSTINSPDGSQVVFMKDGTFNMNKFSIGDYGFDSFKAGTIKGTYTLIANKVTLTTDAGVEHSFTASISKVTELEINLTKELIKASLEASKTALTDTEYQTKNSAISVYERYDQSGYFTKD